MNTKMDTPTKVLKYSIWGCLYLALITPLLISSRFVFPFITLKTISFRILVEIALFLYILLAISNSYYRPKMNKNLWAIIIFGFIVFLTSMVGVNPYRSFWGTIERGEGFIFIIHLLTFAFILPQVFKYKREWMNFFKASLSVSFLVGLYAIAQSYNLSIPWIVTNSAGSRWSSTLGNASYLGAYALGNFWIALLLFIKSKVKWEKVIYIFLGLFNIYLLFQTQTRGAILAFIVTLFLFTILYIFSTKHKKIKIAFITFLIFLIASAGFIFINRDKEWLAKSGPFHRMLNISANDITVQSRLLALDSSLQGWRDRFLLGYGWENYNVAFNKYFHAEIYRDAGSQIWFDRAHNTVFDLAIASGLIGLLAYLSIYLLSYLTLFKTARHNHTNLALSYTVAAFLTAHFLQNIFVFDSLPTYIMLFSIFAYIIYLENSRSPIKEQQPQIKPINIPLVIISFSIFIIVAFTVNIKPLQANMIAIDGLKEFYIGNVTQGIEYFEQAINLSTYQTPELRQKLAENILGRNNKTYLKDSQLISQNFDLALKYIQDNIDLAPLDAQNYLYQMALYNAAANNSGKIEYLKQVISSGGKALKLSPTRPQIYFEMGRAAITMNQAEEGIGYFKKAVSLNPTVKDSHWQLLTAYIITGQNENAQAEFQTLLSLGVREDIPTLERLVQIFNATKNYSLSIPVYQKLIQLNSANSNYWTSLATNYGRLGQKNKAKETAVQIKQLFPEVGLKVEQFIEQLESI